MSTEVERKRRWPFGGLFGELDLLRTVVDGHAASILSHLRAALSPRPVPAFVSVLVVGTFEGKPIFFGRSESIDRGTTIELGPVMRPLDDVSIIVFADMRRVAVHGIFAGVDLLQGALGQCPIAKMHETLLPGVKLQVLCELRTENVP